MAFCRDARPARLYKTQTARLYKKYAAPIAAQGAAAPYPMVTLRVNACDGDCFVGIDLDDGEEFGIIAALDAVICRRIA